MRSSAFLNFSASALSMRACIASVVGGPLAASAKFRFSTIVLRARSSASRRKCRGSGCAVPTRMSRAHSLTVSGSARLAMSLYSASVTLVLIDFVRRVAIVSRCNAKIGPRSAAPVRATDSTSFSSAPDVPNEEPSEGRSRPSPPPSERSESGTTVPLQHPAGGDVSSNSRCAAALFATAPLGGSELTPMGQPPRVRSELPFVAARPMAMPSGEAGDNRQVFPAHNQCQGRSPKGPSEARRP